MFEDSGFEIYETSIRMKCETEKMEKTNRQTLQMRETLKTIKEKYYEIAEHTADWSAEERASQIQRWLNWLDKLTKPIRSRGVKEALQKLKKKKTAALAVTVRFEAQKGKKRQRDDDDDDE